MFEWLLIIYFVMIVGIILEALLGYPFGRCRICFMFIPPFIKRFSWNEKHWYGLTKDFKFVWKKELVNGYFGDGGKT